MLLLMLCVYHRLTVALPELSSLENHPWRVVAGHIQI